MRRARRGRAHRRASGCPRGARCRGESAGSLGCGARGARCARRGGTDEAEGLAADPQLRHEAALVAHHAADPARRRARLHVVHAQRVVHAAAPQHPAVAKDAQPHLPQHAVRARRPVVAEARADHPLPALVLRPRALAGGLRLGHARPHRGGLGRVGARRGAHGPFFPFFSLYAFSCVPTTMRSRSPPPSSSHSRSSAASGAALPAFHVKTSTFSFRSSCLSFENFRCRRSPPRAELRRCLRAHYQVA